MAMTPTEAISYIRRNDCDFLTPDVIRAYTGCTEAQARAALIETMGADWFDRTARA